MATDLTPEEKRAREEKEAEREKHAREEQVQLAAAAETRTRLARLTDLVRDHGTHEEKQQVCEALLPIGKSIQDRL